jgi:hypothetical protein
VVVACVPVAMIVMMGAAGRTVVVRVAEDDSANDIYHQAGRCNDHRFAIVHGLWRQQPVDGAEHHQRRDHEQEDSAGVARQYLDFPGTECKARIDREFARRAIGKRTEANRHHVRTHVPSIGHQCNRIRPPPNRQFGNHHGDRDPDHAAGSAFGSVALARITLLQLAGQLAIHVLVPVHFTSLSLVCACCPAAFRDGTCH